MEDNAYDVLAFEVPFLSHKALEPFVVLVLSKYKSALFAKAPACKSPRRLLDVLLGIVASPQGEKLQQLSGEVFVGAALAVLLVVEKLQHGRILGDGQQQVAEFAQGMLAEGVDLLLHIGGHRRFAGEVSVPKEAHFFSEFGFAFLHLCQPSQVEGDTFLAHLSAEGLPVGLLHHQGISLGKGGRCLQRFQLFGSKKTLQMHRKVFFSKQGFGLLGAQAKARAQVEVLYLGRREQHKHRRK